MGQAAGEALRVIAGGLRRGSCECPYPSPYRSSPRARKVAGGAHRAELLRAGFYGLAWLTLLPHFTCSCNHIDGGNDWIGSESDVCRIYWLHRTWGERLQL
jgi:hypothetical protein